MAPVFQRLIQRRVSLVISKTWMPYEIPLYFQRSQLICSLKHALSTRSVDSALSLVKIIEKVPHFTHSRSSLKALGIALAKFRRFSELKGLINSIRNKEFPGVSTESIDMDEFLWHAASGDLDSVLHLWDKTKGHRGRRCVEVYNVLMGIHAKAGNNSKAVKVFYKMMEENAAPNSRTYATMIEHLVSSGKLDSAIEVFRILPRMRIRRSSRMYAALLKGFVDARRIEDVSDLRKEMQIDGVLLPLRQCSDKEGEDDDEDEDEEDRGDVELASKIKFDLEALSALDDANLAWTSSLVCKILWRMMSNNKVEDIWAFYCWLGSKPGRFTHDAYTASTMLKILAMRWTSEWDAEQRNKGFTDNWDGELITKIKEDGISLSYNTLNYIIERRGLRGVIRLFGRAEEICHPLSKFHHMILYSTFMRKVSHRRQLAFPRGPLDLLDEMISRGILPDIPTFTGLMHYFLVKKEIIIRAYLRRGKVDQAFKAFQDMRDSNFMPDAATKAFLVKHLSKKGKLEEVAVVEAGSQEINRLPPLQLHGYVWNVSSFDLERVYNIYFDSF
ncbi:hypothetical protein FH972_003411 [Carpinus fangiana]|uniref:Pentacotripeptide-repeat region of PRORP domain-containing protein n=1 Tax=Carpinus fangiana TaxID=176857 RepID=A0A5N6QHX0_9ROSI|nr:hypothetical protein FH972_003411 [Carpinus fangiana]